MNFVNQVQAVANSLPNENSIIVIDRVSPNGKVKKLIVDPKTIHVALVLLKDINPHFNAIEINRNLIKQVSEGGETSLIDDLENLYDTCNLKSFVFIFLNFS